MTDRIMYKVGPILPGELNLTVTYRYDVIYYHIPCAYSLENQAQTPLLSVQACEGTHDT
jgi:hypothetical protein